MKPSKKLIRLQKALKKMGLNPEYDAWPDEKVEWLSLEIINGDNKAIISFHPDGETTVHHLKKEFDESLQKKIV